MTGNLEGGVMGQCGAYNNWLAVVQATNFNTYNKYWTGARETDDLSPSVNLQWDVSDRTMLYVTYSRVLSLAVSVLQTMAIQAISLLLRRPFRLLWTTAFKRIALFLLSQ